MYFEKRLNLRLAAEDISILESEEELETSIQSGPDKGTYRSIIDAIKKFFHMSPRDLLQFATEGGSIEEDAVVIESLTPQTILEQQVKRTVHSGNYAKILEVRMPGQGFEYKGFIVVKLSDPNERIEKNLQNRMASWKPGQPVPFKWYKTEDEALKAMSAAEAKAAGKSPTPAQPIKQKVTKSPVNQVAAKMAERMGAQDAATEIIKMSNENIVKFADLGLKTQKSSDNWSMVKTVFLAYLALAALVTGAAGLATLVLGYLAVKGWEAYKRSGIKEDLDDKDEFGDPCFECRYLSGREFAPYVPDERLHAAHLATTAEAISRGLEDREGRHMRIRRKWGADPQAWQQVWDEVMGQHGFTRDMSSGQAVWVRTDPE